MANSVFIAISSTECSWPSVN